MYATGARECKQIRQGATYKGMISMDPAHIAELCQFVGYGPLEAPLVFLGIEEKGRHPDAHPEDIEVRVEHFDVPVMDVGDAHERLPAPNPFHAPPGARPVQQGTTAAYFALELLVPLGLADQALRPDEYWREHLGRAHGQTLLAECYPVPRPSMGKAVLNYHPHDVWDHQRQLILTQFFQQNMPLFVVAYGAPTWQLIGPLFGVPAGNGWISVNAVVNGQHRVAGDVCLTESGVVVCRTRFFGSWGRFNRQCIPFLTAQMHALLSVDL